MVFSHKAKEQPGLLILNFDRCRPVGAAECNEAAIFPQTLKSQAKDQKIAAFGSSYSASGLWPQRF
jgi:hypothetical protein